MKVKAKGDTRIRFQPFTNNDAYVAGVLPGGSVIDAQPVESAPGWYRFDLTAGGLGLRNSVLNRWSPYSYALQELFTLVIDPPIERDRYAHAKYQLGVNVLQFADYGFRALRDGCRFVMFMDNGGAAVQAAREYPDAIIMYRKYHNSRLDAQSMFNLIDLDWRTIPSNLFVTLSNESDTWNPNNLIEYLDWFKQVASLIWNVNPAAKLCFGSWGHGNPNWTDAGVARDWRTVVAPWLNANAHRVVCDLHTYTKGKRRPSHPPSDAAIIGTDWFETRHKFAYDNGLSHAVRHMSGEAGVEAGHGGFTWANYSEQQFREWATDVVNAQRSKTPLLMGGALYHYGEHAGWAGYHLTRYYGVLTQLWREDVPYGVAA